MRPLRFPVVALFLVLPLVACESEQTGDEGATTETPAAAAEEMPITTASEEALAHYEAGRRALDMGRPDEARAHFEQGVATDSEFAMGYFGLASAANSLESFKENLDLATEYAAGASEAERLRIEEMRADFENDVEAQMAAATRLTEIAPKSPRAWMTLASVQSDMGDEEAARESLEKAIELDPEFAPAHMVLGNSYLFVEPVDPSQARTHMERAVELEPDEAITHDLLGDAYRAQGMLEEAATEYGRTAELDEDSGNGFQQRGHVHSFLGNYEEARADYDAAIEIERGKNAAASFAVYRALVSVHEGSPGAAVDELEALADEIDGMGIPDPRGLKIFALDTAVQIALHAGMPDRAEAALERRNALLVEQAAAAGTAAAERNVAAAKALGRGWLAARRENHDAALAAAEEARTALEPGNEPDRFEPVHALIGFVRLQQENYEEAVRHHEQANPDDIYAVYHHAMALEGAGRNEEANALYRKVADWRFNSPGLALVRADASAKVGG